MIQRCALESGKTYSPEDFAQGRETVLMEFDKPVRFTIAYQDCVLFPAGVHPVPREWSDHWYLKAHGACRWGKR